MENKVTDISEESAAVRKALSGLDEYAEQWAKEIRLDKWIDNILGDREKTRAILIQSFIEGAYRGRISHLTHPQGKE